MLSNRPYVAALIGFLCTLFVYPIAFAAIKVVSVADGCTSEAWFCGFNGLILVPIAFVVIAAFALRAERIKGWLATPIASAVILYLAYGSANQLSFANGQEELGALALLGALLFGVSSRVAESPSVRRSAKRLVVRAVNFRITKKMMDRHRSNWYWVAVLVVPVALVVVLAMRWDTQHIQNQDTQTSGDLRNIQAAIQADYLSTHSMPSSLSKVKFNPLWYGFTSSRLADYTYSVEGSGSFRLCARFNFAATGAAWSDPSEPLPFAHGRGSQCFDSAVRTSP
jgi:hypothetical protein